MSGLADSIALAVWQQSPRTLHQLRDVIAGMLAEQQKLGALAEEGLAYFECLSGDEGDRKYIAAIRNALAATGKQQVGEVQGDARAQFEAWARKFGHDLTRRSIGRQGDDSYIDDFALYAWTAWQAALAARQPGAQEPVAEVIRNPAGQTAIVFEDGKTMLDHVGAKLYAAPLAQGIDLGQLRSLLVRINEDEDGDSYHNLSCDALDLIDQRGAAPGVERG